MKISLRYNNCKFKSRSRALYLFTPNPSIFFFSRLSSKTHIDLKRKIEFGLFHQGQPIKAQGLYPRDPWAVWLLQPLPQRPNIVLLLTSPGPNRLTSNSENMS